MGVTHGQPLSDPSNAQGGNPSVRGTFAYYPCGSYAPQAPMRNNIPTYNRFIHPSATPSNNYPFHTQPVYPQPNAQAYPNYGSTGLFANSNGCVTQYYPLPNGLMMPSHVGSYDGKRDLDNY
ncbi:hypothetical protein Tco_0240373, partial [Tanacetum coccineum]